MIIINQLTDEGLLNIYSKSCSSIARKKTNSAYLPELSLESLQVDNDHILREINHRIPVAYKWEIEKLQHETLTNSAQPGQWYKHHKLGLFKLQIIDHHDYNGPLWVCRAFIGRVYL